MPEPRTQSTAGRDYERLALGVVALLLLTAGGVAWLTSDVPQGWEGVALRSGAVFGAIWLALPNLREMPPGRKAGFGVIVAFVVLRPKLILWSIPFALLVAVIARRRR